MRGRLQQKGNLILYLSRAEGIIHIRIDKSYKILYTDCVRVCVRVVHVGNTISQKWSHSFHTPFFSGLLACHLLLLPPTQRNRCFRRWSGFFLRHSWRLQAQGLKPQSRICIRNKWLTRISPSQAHLARSILGTPKKVTESNRKITERDCGFYGFFSFCYKSPKNHPSSKISRLSWGCCQQCNLRLVFNGKLWGPQQRRNCFPWAQQIQSITKNTRLFLSSRAEKKKMMVQTWCESWVNDGSMAVLA